MLAGCVLTTVGASLTLPVLCVHRLKSLGPDSSEEKARLHINGVAVTRWKEPKITRLCLNN